MRSVQSSTKERVGSRTKCSRSSETKPTCDSTPPPAFAEPRVTVSTERVSCSTSPSIRAEPWRRTKASSPRCVVSARIRRPLRARASELEGGVKQRIVVGESTEAGTRWSPKRQRAVVSAGRVP